MKRILLLASFLLILSVSYSQQDKIDSLKVILKTSTIDSIKLNTYNVLITQYSSHDLELAKKYLDTMMQLSKDLKSKRHELTAYAQEGILSFRQENINEALLFWKKGLADTEIDEHPKQKSNFLNNIAIAYKIQKEKDSVLKYLMSAIKLNEKENNDIGLIGNYYGISDFFFQEKEYDNAIIYLNKLHSVALRTNKKYDLARVDILLATISRKEYDFPDAIKYFKAALNYYLEEEPNNLVMIRGLKYEVIRTKLRQKRFDETIEDLESLKENYEGQLDNKVFWQQVDLDLFISYYNTPRINEGYPLYKKISESEVDLTETLEGIKLSALSKFEILTDRINKNTFKNLTKAYDIAKKLEAGDQLLFCTNLLALYHLKKNNIDLSYNFLREEEKVRDSLSFLESRIVNLS